MTTAIISNPSAALDLNFVFRRFGAGIKVCINFYVCKINKNFCFIIPIHLVLPITFFNAKFRVH